MAKPVNLPYGAPEEPGVYSISLHFQQAGSDKVYQLSIEEKGGGFVVNFANGRTGGTLATGTKTREPVDYAAARKICNATLNEKVGKGYNPTSGSHLGAGAAAEAISTAERKSSGIIPQLLNPVPAADVEQFINDPAWLSQEKHDGERRLLIVRDGEAVGGNRLGKTVALPAMIAKDALALGLSHLVLDGEQIGNSYHCWDVLEHEGRDLRQVPLTARLELLEGLGISGGSINVTYTARRPGEKRALLDRVMEAGGEGIVFKDAGAVYEPGRPNSGGDWRKFKLYQTLSAAVGRLNDQRSVGLSLKDGNDNWIDVGNVTIPPNQTYPEIGDVVEVRYLYAFDGGSLFQPTYLGKRNDILLDDCSADQRMFKPAATPALEQESPDL